MTRLPVRLAIAAGLFGALGLSGSPATAQAEPASGAPGGVSVRPVLRPGLDPARSYFELKAEASSMLDEAVVVTNTGPSSVVLLVSGVDGKTGATSGSVFANRQDPVEGAGRWITPAVGRIALAPGAGQEIRFTVRVPDDAQAGDHLAGLAFENADPIISDGGFQIRQVLRTVIGVLVVVPGPATFHPTLTDVGIDPMGMTEFASVTVALGNAGRAMAMPDLTVALSGPNSYRKSLRRTLDTVLPSASIDFPFPWPDALPAGDYDITATLSGGGTSVTITRQVRLSSALVAATPGPPSPPSEGAGPLWIILIVVSALAAGLGGRYLRTRRDPALGRPGATDVGRSARTGIG
jgi:hypothetical protein